MAFHEVAMHEVTEVLRLWSSGVPLARIAQALALDRKTIRRYVEAAKEAGLQPGGTPSHDQLAGVAALVQAMPGRPHGESWAACEARRGFISEQLGKGLKLTKVRRLLARSGVEIPYPTLHRFAVSELGFGLGRTTLPVVDGEPGQELQLDTGWVGTLEPDVFGHAKKFRAWIFTPSFSRYRFVSPVLEESTRSCVEACEAAWAFYGGVFRVLVPDNTKAIVDAADPLSPRINAAFREYAQARGFHIDPARVRSPRDKGRVERSVQPVRDDCFAGEKLLGVEHARERAVVWCGSEIGMRRHASTGRMPREHFEAMEQAQLLPAPTEAFDVPVWCTPKVARDQHAQVAKGLYSLPTQYVGKSLRARADRQTVRFYESGRVVKVHPRVAAGKRSTDVNDFPRERATYAMRDVAFLQKQAASHGECVGRFAAALLDSPLPWTRMRAVYALLGLCKRYGDERVREACTRALDAQMHDVVRLRRMLEGGRPPPLHAAAAANVIPLARYLRPASQFALPLALPRAESTQPQKENDDEQS
jgi:transposase